MWTRHGLHKRYLPYLDRQRSYMPYVSHWYKNLPFVFTYFTLWFCYPAASSTRKNLRWHQISKACHITRHGRKVFSNHSRKQKKRAPPLRSLVSLISGCVISFADCFRLWREAPPYWRHLPPPHDNHGCLCYTSLLHDIFIYDIWTHFSLGETRGTEAVCQSLGNSDDRGLKAVGSFD